MSVARGGALLAVAALGCQQMMDTKSTGKATALPLTSVQVRLVVPESPAEPLRVEYRGRLGRANGCILRMARSVVGSYRSYPFAKFVRNLTAQNSSGWRLEVEAVEQGVWKLKGRDDVASISYDVDTAAAQRAIADPHAVTRRRGAHMTLVGYGVFLEVEGAEARPHAVELDIPAGWNVAWSLEPEGERRYVARSAFELIDEPAFLGTEFRSLPVENVASPHTVHVWSEDPDVVVRSLDTLAAAVRASARGIEALGLPALGGRYHVMCELFQPRQDGRLGWAMEHSRSFHAVDRTDRLGALQPGLVYHVTHHELHSWLPRRLYTESLEPARLVEGNTTGAIYFAEGFAQYLAFCALARSRTVETETVLAMLAERFALAYAEQAPPEPRSLVEQSLVLSGGDQQHWAWEFAAGGLVAMWIDELGRLEKDGWHGLSDAIVEVYGRWAERAGIPDSRLEEVLSAALRVDVREVFERHVRGRERLPVDTILERAGVVREGDGYRVLTDAEAAVSVQTFRHRAFR